MLRNRKSSHDESYSIDVEELHTPIDVDIWSDNEWQEILESANYSPMERVNYYITYPHYFMEVLCDSIRKCKWLL